MLAPSLQAAGEIGWDKANRKMWSTLELSVVRQKARLLKGQDGNVQQRLIHIFLVWPATQEEIISPVARIKEEREDI